MTVNTISKEYLGYIHVFHIRSCTERTGSFTYYFVTFGQDVGLKLVFIATKYQGSAEIKSRKIRINICIHH